MLIALDHDGTYTRDPELWDCFIAKAKERGHTVKVLTMRFPSEPIQVGDLETVYTSRAPKYGVIPADIYIDDMPQFLFQGG